ncbi:hypothetical protein BAUCODRAFT_27281 [Baudoinia panamericana UAMH 10762]|uniref:Myb-like domain-containing protein n=1 Tax=Baudoinia panamericana (strain UAMH 10762) TaxID=717646 RepID=M2M9B0_BAUPA|nr:uncharacterized protein BAUCODRAFT_27281 [Baudoinia panamericana UAMH 10762]EMC92976.1 hypothetical protein BAUCODRAFT_27281 [Baudoinia panamericana UAMH 10762]
MAKLSSTQAGSQQTSSVPAQDVPSASAPARVTRSLRSNSREPSVPLAEPRDAATPKRRGRKAQNQTQDLTTVEEHVVDDEELQAQALAAQQMAAEAAAGDIEFDDMRRASQHSVFSGTTAKTRFSQEEIADLDADIMIDRLPELAKAAEQMANFLMPANPQERHVVWKEIRHEGSRFNKLYVKRLSSLHHYRTDFSSQDYVQPSIVLRALLDKESMDGVPAGSWRPDSIIYRVNLAQLLLTMLVFVRDSTEFTEEGYNAFAELDTQFATAIAGPVFDPEAVHFCFELQTQLVLARLHVFQHDPSFDPLHVINGTFYAQDAPEGAGHVNADGLHMFDISEDEQTAWTENLKRRADDLRAPFAGRLPIETALNQLRGKYPWEHFVNHVQRYYEHRNADLERQIAAAGGYEPIMTALEKEVQRHQGARTADNFRQSIGKPHSTPLPAFGKSAIAQLRDREQRLSGMGIAPPAASEPAVRAPTQTDTVLTAGMQSGAQAAPVAQMDPRLVDPGYPDVGANDGFVPPPNDDVVVGQPSAQERAVSALELSGFQKQQKQRQKAQKGKARFTDRQENAQRVVFDEASQPSQQVVGGEDSEFQTPGRASAAGPYHVGSAAKRPFERVDDDELPDFEPTQDEGFEVDQRGTAGADARRRQAPAATPRASLRGASSSNTVAYDIPASQAPSPTKRHRKNPGSAIPTRTPYAPDDDPIPHGSYQHARAVAKQQRILASQNKPPQVRKPWSNAEELALVSLIENYGGNGVSYAALKKLDQTNDNVLSARSAEDLRFKARNMKQTFILGGADLPENWDQVVLDRKAILKLEERGFSYTQEPTRTRHDMGEEI